MGKGCLPNSSEGALVRFSTSIGATVGHACDPIKWGKLGMGFRVHGSRFGGLRVRVKGIGLRSTRGTSILIRMSVPVVTDTSNPRVYFMATPSPEPGSFCCTAAWPRSGYGVHVGI